MGSGPRRGYGKEGFFDHIPLRESPPSRSRVLETPKIPPDEGAAIRREAETSLTDC